jgi:DMSO/TMAO reductase YedYZ molybdopterin-dependent catalytic subunit
MIRRLWSARGATAGLLAAAVSLGVAELVAGLRRGTAGPIVSVGGWVIDHTPPAMKTFAVRTFGTNDKRALIVGTVVLLALFAAAVGLVAVRRLRLGAAGVALFGLVGVGAALTRPTAALSDVLPSVIGAASGIVALVLICRSNGNGVQPMPGQGDDRRRFLMTAAGFGVLAAGTGGLGRTLGKRFSVSAARSGVALPKASSVALPVPAGVDLGVPGVAAFMTPNADFYRIDTTLATPQVDPARWRLTIRGMVDKPFTLSYQDLLDRPLVERDITMVCVSNEVGGNYIGTARWLGVPLATILKQAGVQPGATQLVSRSVDGWTAGSPVAEVMDGRDAVVAVGMNGEVLPIAHGFPARLVVPGLYGFVSATKWVTELELTTFEAYDPYWAKRGWAKRAPIKTMARIDTPRGLSRVKAGPMMIGGVAWAIHRGIGAVEVKIDDGAWQPAKLGNGPSADTWRQWSFAWEATAGTHSVACRATDGTGQVQTETRAQPIPDGASGWHSIIVIVDP